uniref:Condensin complex subunit 2 n=1 Tax=Panagrolaimus sp. ES5 TaxID=591445 RepID=A0AC34F0F9_9BILA
MHNEWCDEDDGMLQSQEDKNGPDDGSFLYYPKSDTQEDKEEEVEKDIDDVDILDGVLEQFQGTFELATSASHKLEDEWIEMLGLERRDLRPSNNTNISFEQTANDNFDLEKRLVDRLIIDGEDEAMKAEENRIEKIVKTIFSERIQLPGGPGNINENSLHRQINSPPSVEIYQNEDIFFPFDQSKYITTESIDAQIALSRSYFIKNTNIKNAKSYGIFEKLFEALKSCNSPVIPLPDEIIQIVETLPNYSYIKCLFAADTVSKFDSFRTSETLSSSLTPFRIARYSEHLSNSVIHEVQSFLSAEKGVSVFLKERITKHFSPESIHTLLAFLKFYEDYRAAASMETDHDFNHDFDFDETATDFYDALSSFDQTLAVEESQVIFTNANSNDTTTATMEIDHVVENNDDSARENNFNATFFENVRHEEAAEESDDSLAEIVGNFEVPKKPATKTSTRPKRTVKKIEFVFDDSHWETAADKRARKKKPIVREELENHFNDDLLFAPRKTFENVTISRRRENSPLSLISLLLRQSPRIPRCQDSSLPDIICNKFLYRLELGQTIPGYADHDKLFMCTRLNEYMRRSFQQNAVLYRGKYSFLPSISTTRQRDNFAFWLKTFRLCSNLSDAAASTINDTETNDSENNCDGLSNDDAIDHDFDAPSSPPPQMQSKNAGQFKDSFMRQYKPYFDEDGDDEEEEFDDFDFESRIDKMAALESFDGKFALKRAIKYILTKPQYDRSTLPDEISGIKAPSPKIAEDLPTSTPLLQKKQSRFEFISEDDEIIASENHQNDMDVNEDVEESDFENDSDETRMKNFEVDGFHTMKSLLYYLPQFCYPDTVRVLSVAYVFCTLCHMANENSLNLIQELVQLDGSTEATSDCRIMNLENAESEGNENDSDEENSSSPLFEISDSAEL